MRRRRRTNAPHILALLCAAAVLAATFFALRPLFEPTAADPPDDAVSDGQPDPAPVEPEPEPTPDDRARALLNEMTLEQKVGQLFIARCPLEEAPEKAARWHLGGYILFARDFRARTPEQVTETIQSYQRAAATPLFIGVDEEGGTVTRVSRYPEFREEPFPSPQEVYAAGGFPAVAQDAAEKCELLASLGINLNFAPVCDISTDPGDFIYPRSFGADASETAQYVETVVTAMRGRGMGSVLKHFPGYGSNADTHTGVAHDERPYEVFTDSNFLPFEAGIAAGADMVLVSHNIVASMDGELPASLSARVHEILRQELGFSGVIVTDDLAMDGVRQLVSDERAAVLAVLAGNDLLCCTDFETQIPAVLDAVASGEITEQRIDESVLRILKCKMELGIIPPE
ncbi:glycoside hydrolase family 3 protein [Feifania hominis]|uniref:Beta-hexosaminidase n=1 Tax=Feifania hominis TaxID=2763660 RepID=A0A926HV40_9FIRM|nr:glycoside hydrolase family 3 N-terminal domain-containing protein [Feifania hominis]MBC8536943.1 beta-hexosaminidase [Feifania hominis]